MLYSVLLAGGQSSRMGQDKTQLEYAGSTLLQHSVELLQASGADRVLVSGDVPGQECITDLLPNCGPLGGLHATLHYLDEHGQLDGSSLLLVIPVDMPMLTPAALQTLLDSICDAPCCHYAGEIFPCVFRLQPGLRDTLDSMFVDGTELGGARSMKALLKNLSGIAVAPANLSDTVFLNLNRPEDWERFREISNLQAKKTGA